MSVEERVAREIESFKNLVSEIDSHTDDSKFFYKLRIRAKYIARDIERIHSAYYIAFIEYRSDDNFVRVYYPLGLMTAEQAYGILNEKSVGEAAEPWYDSGIIEVTKEKLDKFYDLIEIQKLYDDFYHNRNVLKDILPPDFIDNLKNKRDNIRKELGFTYSWMRVSSF